MNLSKNMPTTVYLYEDEYGAPERQGHYQCIPPDIKHEAYYSSEYIREREKHLLACINSEKSFQSKLIQLGMETGKFAAGETVCPAKAFAAIENELRLLHALRVAGVDNWDGYTYAIELLNAN